MRDLIFNSLSASHTPRYDITGARIPDEEPTVTTRTFGPAQTREWSTDELGALVGKQITIDVNGAEWAGRVLDAGIDLRDPYVDLTAGGVDNTVDWSRDRDEVTITVTYPEA